MWGISVADFNRDGILTSCPARTSSGPATTRREIYTQQTINPSTECSNAVWMQFSSDFTGDGWERPELRPGLRLPALRQSRQGIAPVGQIQVTTGRVTEIAVMTDVNGDDLPTSCSAETGRCSGHAGPGEPTGPWKQHIISECGDHRAWRRCRRYQRR
jgi:hypothetical protein